MLDKIKGRALEDPASGCWLWQGAISDRGYGVVYHKRRLQGVHRLSFELACRPLAKGEVVCHRCDTPSCCNPAHLFVGSQADNLRDMVAKGRASRPNAKLTQEQADEIRAQVASGRRQKDVAAEFGVHSTLVSMIVANKVWSRVEK